MLEQPLRQVGAYAAVADGEGPRAEQQQAADDVVGQRLAHPGAVRADQRELHALEVAPADVGVREGAEPGRDAVHHLVLLDGVADHRPARLPSGPRRRAPSSARASPRATATRSSSVRASPVTVTVRMAGNLALGARPARRSAHWWPLRLR